VRQLGYAVDESVLDALSRSGFNTVVGNDFGWKFKRGICSTATAMERQFCGESNKYVRDTAQDIRSGTMILSAGKLAQPKVLAKDRGRLSFRPLAAAVQAGL
jgi:hypothetical protein